MINVAEEWQQLTTALLKQGGTVYVIGATDRGKSTFCRHIIETLAERMTVALLDCDTGQSTIGPPSTIGLGLYAGNGFHPRSVHLRFAGSTSPRGHVPEFLVASKRLFEKAQALGADAIMIDSPGFVSGHSGQEFQFQMIDLLQPGHIVAFQKNREIEPILTNFTGHSSMDVHRFSVPNSVVARSMTERRVFREQCFKEYFSTAEYSALSLIGRGIHGRLPETFRSEAWHHLLLALCDHEQVTHSLGIVVHLDLIEQALNLYAPPFDPEKITSIHVGTLFLDSIIH